MRFSQKDEDRRAEVGRVLRMCKVSQEDRRSRYRNSKHVYLYGTTKKTQGRARKVKPIINRLASFLYAPDSVAFWLQLPPGEISPIQFGRIEPTIDWINDNWQDSGLGRKIAIAVRWALVFGTMIIKMVPRSHVARQVDENGVSTGPLAAASENSLCPQLIYPGDFGVYLEEHPDLLGQQAVCHTSYVSEAEMRTLLTTVALKEGKTDSQAQNWIDYIINNAKVENNEMAQDGATVFVTTATSTQVTGIAPADFSAAVHYSPMTAEHLFAVDDLHVWDDQLADYRLFTVSGNCVIFDRPAKEVGGIKGRLPYGMVTPIPLYDYIWGESLSVELAQMQEWFLTRLEQMDLVFEMNLRKPKLVKGMGNNQDAMMQALNQPGGRAYTANPAASVQEMDPQIPESAFEIMSELDTLFTEMSGMRPAMFGKQEAGVRTEGMASSLMRVSASEVREQALLVEDDIQGIAQLMYRFLCDYSDDELPEINEQTGDYTGDMFHPGDLPESTVVKVDGHSQSPLFVEDHAQLAQGLMRYGAIDQTTLIELLRPPLMGLMKHRLKRIQFAKLVAAQKMKLEEDAKRSGKEK